ncbi:thioredoxin family protein [Caloranaerobacter azorensis]|uniref:thioredoxin family protein n=1 Tax=Caloranaerobacter azorensis TaxID=116090 RepID=UPI001953A322|nr:thioredoxin family protein [Caloranaerobacter azorensis]
MDISCLYDKGVSFDEFVNKDKDAYKEKVLEILNKIRLSDELINKIKIIDKKIKVLVCAEIWCPDCMINVPVLAKMKEYNNNIDISIVEKNGNEDFFIKYSEEDRIKIPTFVFLMRNLKSLAVLLNTRKK